MDKANISGIDQDVSDLFPHLIEVRRHIHSRPEVGPEQPNTVNYVKTRFQGMENVLLVAGDPRAGLVVDIVFDNKGPTIAFRADMDALELSESVSPDHFPNRHGFRSVHKNKMHACGHDVHTAILAGFGKLIKNYGHRLKGKVRLLFQPGEEGHGGGRHMVEAGYLDDVSNVFALHCWPNLAVGQIGLGKGPFFASIDYFTVTLSGMGGHGAAPEKASDQILAMSRMINDLQGIITRRISGLEPAVLSVCSANAGFYEAPTVMPEKAQFRGSVRAFSREVRKTIETEFKSVCEHIARSVHPECKVDIDYKAVYPPTVNDPGAALKLEEVLAGFIPQENLFTDHKPTLGGEDFSFMTQKVPGAIFLLGATPPKKLSPKTVFLHNPCFDVDERAMLFGVQAFKALAIELLSKSSGY